MTKAREEALEKDYDELIYAISHDLRAPLRSIMAVVKWVQTDYGDALDERGNDLLEMMESGSLRLAVKFERLVEFGRADHTEDMYSVPMDAVVERLRQRYPEASFWLSGDEVSLTGDPGRIEKLFDELASNACYFSDKESPQIQVATEELGDTYRVRITDDGPGLRPGEMESLFRLFFTSVSEEVKEKCGMGLPICRRIVTAHGATIAVSEPSVGGVCVEINWPRNETAE